MRRLFLALLLLLFAFPAHALEEWTTTDTILEVATEATLLIDWMQTRTIVLSQVCVEDYPCFWAHTEGNPLLGPHPSMASVNSYFTALTILHPVVARLLPQPYRGWWQCITFGVELGVIRSNYHNGLTLTLPF